MGGLDDHVAGMCAPGRRRFHAIDSVACPQRRHTGSDCRNRAGKIVAQNQRKAGRTEQGEQALAIALAPSLLPSGAPLGFVAILGVLALIGILIRNSVILIVQVEDLRRTGRPAWDAAVHDMLSEPAGSGA
jgi:hypothetical protein